MSDEWNKEMENTPSQPGEGDATPFEKPVQQDFIDFTRADYQDGIRTATRRGNGTFGKSAECP